jgi:hypothetical protein
VLRARLVGLVNGFEQGSVWGSTTDDTDSWVKRREAGAYDNRRAPAWGEGKRREYRVAAKIHSRVVLRVGFHCHSFG